MTAAGMRARWLLPPMACTPAYGAPWPWSPTRDRRLDVRGDTACGGVAIEPWTDLVEVHWSTDAEAYVTPVGPRQVGIAVLFSGRGHYDGWLEGFRCWLHACAAFPAPHTSAAPDPYSSRALVGSAVVCCSSAMPPDTSTR